MGCAWAVTVRDLAAEEAELATWRAACVSAARESNPVTQENCNASGALPPRFWDVNGGGDASVQGFADRASYIPGSLVTLRVRLRAELLADVIYGGGGNLSDMDLGIDIWRFGYYGGQGARLVGTVDRGSIDMQAAMAQPECHRDASVLLVDCGTWNPVAQWRIPGTIASGLFAARLVLRPRVPGARDGILAGVGVAGRLSHPRPRTRSWRVDNAQTPPSEQFANKQHDYRELPPCGADASVTAGTGGLSCRESRLRHALGARLLDAAGGDTAATSAQALVEPATSLVFFVVRPGRGQRREVVVQLSDVTWRAYNYYAGPNVYGMPPEARHRFDLRGQWADASRRAHKLSLNAPLVVRDSRGVNSPLGAELAGIMWLERSGYDVGYVSGVDTHCSGSRLVRSAAGGFGARAFVSLGHDEYWSGRQRAVVEKARDSGVSLAFWSGNEAYWRVRWEAGMLGSAPWEALEAAAPATGARDPARLDLQLSPEEEESCNPRTLVVYKESQADAKLDPRADEWTGTFRDASPHNPVAAGEGQAENALTGLLWGVNAYRADSLEVPWELLRLRQWRGTDARSAVGRPGQAAVLQRGILGHEWDVDADTASRPAGMARFSLTRVHNVLHIVDNGASFDTASAEHRLVAFRARGGCGSLVWGTGTVQWAWGLEALHDRQTGAPTFAESDVNARVGRDQHGPDQSVRQLSVNMLADMGVLPGEGGAFLPAGVAVRAEAAPDVTPPHSSVLFAAAFNLPGCGGPDGVLLRGRQAASSCPGLPPRVRALTAAAARTGAVSFTQLPHVVVVARAEDDGIVAGVEVTLDGKRWHAMRPRWECRGPCGCGEQSEPGSEGWNASNLAVEETESDAGGTGLQSHAAELWPGVGLPAGACRALRECEDAEALPDRCWVYTGLLALMHNNELSSLGREVRSRAVDDSYNVEGACAA